MIVAKIQQLMKTKLILLLAVFVSAASVLNAEPAAKTDSNNIPVNVMNPKLATPSPTKSADPVANEITPIAPESAPALKKRPWKSEEALHRVAEAKDIKSATGGEFSRTDTAKRGDGSSSAALLRFAVSIVIMIAVLGGFYFFMKKFGRRIGGNTNPGTIKVIAKQYIDNKNYLVLVKVYEEEVLLGVSGNGINMLSKFAPIESGDEDEPVAESDRDAVNVSKSITVKNDEAVLKGVKELI